MTNVFGDVRLRGRPPSPEMAACWCLQPVVNACGVICRGTGTTLRRTAHQQRQRPPRLPARGLSAWGGRAGAPEPEQVAGPRWRPARRPPRAVRQTRSRTAARPPRAPPVAASPLPHRLPPGARPRPPLARWWSLALYPQMPRTRHQSPALQARLPEHLGQRLAPGPAVPARRLCLAAQQAPPGSACPSACRRPRRRSCAPLCRACLRLRQAVAMHRPAGLWAQLRPAGAQAPPGSRRCRLARVHLVQGCTCSVGKHAKTIRTHARCSPGQGAGVRQQKRRKCCSKRNGHSSTARNEFQQVHVSQVLQGIGCWRAARKSKAPQLARLSQEAARA